MRIHPVRSVVVIVVLSVFCGCSSGSGKSWSMASMNPFGSSSKDLADSTAPPFEKPSSMASPSDSIPPASGYASTPEAASSADAYAEKAASYSGYNSLARSGYQSGQSSYSSTSPSTPSAYSSASSASRSVSPQQGYYGSATGTGYDTASRTNSSSPGHYYSATSSRPGTAASSSSSYSSSRDSTYPSTTPGSASSGYSSYGGGTDAGSRYASASDRWGTGTSAASGGYDYAKSGSTGSSYTSPASPGSSTYGSATGSASSATSRYGDSKSPYDTAPSAARYSSDRSYVSDSLPSSSLRDRYASASGAAGGSQANDSSTANPWSRPTTMQHERSGYTPGSTGYTPGNTGYQPPSSSTYNSPAGTYTSPGTTGTSDTGYSPGSIDRYRSGSTSSIGTYPSASEPRSSSSYGYSLPPNG